MDRREALMGLVAGASGGITRDFLPKKEKGRVLLVVYLGVGCLSPQKVESFIDKTRDKLRSEKPDNFHFLIIPHREYNTWIDVFSLDGEPWSGGPHPDADEAKAWIEKAIADGKLRRCDGECLDIDDDVIEYCRLMFGSPVIKLPEYFDEAVRDTIEKGKRWGVRNLKQFCVEYLENLPAETTKKLQFASPNWTWTNSNGVRLSTTPNGTSKTFLRNYGDS